MSGRMRPSAYFSACIVRYFLLAPEPCPMRSKMTSTTRTTFLCLLASSMSRAWPCLISETNSSKVLAWPLPKFSVTMLWLVSICLMFSGLVSTIALNSSAFKFRTFESSMNFASVHLAWLHHSKLLVFSACLSYTWKPAATSLWVTRKFPCGLMSFFGLRVLKALHELTTALTDAGIGTSFLDLRHEILVEGLQRLCRRLDGSEEGVVDGSPGRKARLLVPFEGSLQETLAVLATPVRDLHLLNPDVFLPLEREATCHHAENDDSETPNVNFQAVVQLVELRTPVRLRATFRLQTFAFGQVNHSAEIAEVDAATRVFEIHPILQVVVALQIAMHHVALVKPVHTLEHHLAHVLDDRNGDHALRLPMELHAFNHVATPVNLEHHAHEDLLVVDIVQLHDARVRQLLQHVDLLPDLNQRGLHLVNHLHGKLLI
mmetsp:Transcript_38709/g.124404  ORF Transcript_38709/g.124404 Transcript_38709/m.124404 type:complete len:431 (+) Transcript_38709:747-2039(+)